MSHKAHEFLHTTAAHHKEKSVLKKITGKIAGKITRHKS
ncbi:MAG: hypothetical protein FWG35_03325 [Spirochaetaceae bacterium]|nr:hypothetical protein [Spirochaetaceae bacterium]